MNVANQNPEDTVQELEKLREEYVEFAYVVSHDFKAPFRQIEGFAKLIAKNNAGQFDEKSKRYFELLIDGAEKCQDLFESLREFSRLNTRAQPMAEHEIHHSISDAMQRLSYLIATSKAEINLPDIMPKLVADPSQMQQLWYHLFKNALTYQPQGNRPEITVAMRDEGEHWLFTIADNGIGMEEKYLDNIFVVLRRAVGPDEFTGNGMGLAIVKKIAQRHGGRAWATSVMGKGSVFYVTIAKNLVPEVGDKA